MARRTDEGVMTTRTKLDADLDFLGASRRAHARAVRQINQARRARNLRRTHVDLFEEHGWVRWVVYILLTSVLAVGCDRLVRYLVYPEE